jgi:hypothetical protein
MKIWYELTKPQKIVLGIVFLMLVPLMPELAIVVDFGGLEMIVAFTLLNAQPFLMWLKSRYDMVKEWGAIARSAMSKSALAKPRVFVVSGVFCSVAMVLTGSVVLSLAFILPSVVGNGLLI